MLTILSLPLDARLDFAQLLTQALGLTGRAINRALPSNRVGLAFRFLASLRLGLAAGRLALRAAFGRLAPCARRHEPTEGGGSRALEFAILRACFPLVLVAPAPRASFWTNASKGERIRKR